MILFEDKELHQNDIDLAIEEAKEKSKDKKGNVRAKIHGIHLDEYYGVFKAPTSILIDEIKKLDKKKGANSDMYLAEKCLIYPSVDDFKQVINEYPGLLSNVVSQLMVFSKFTAEIEVENL